MKHNLAHDVQRFINMKKIKNESITRTKKTTSRLRAAHK